MSVKKIIAVTTAVVVGGLVIVGCGGEKKAADAAQEIAAVSGADSSVVFCATGDSTFTDPRDGQAYRTVKIGGRMWMAENLNYAMDSSWCYDNKAENCDIYGRLYDWDAAMNACPKGWRLPDTVDWNDLIEVAGGREVAGEKLRSKTGWKPNVGILVEGTDEFAFSALPSGMGFRNNRRFDHATYLGIWWSASERGDILEIWSNSNQIKFDKYNGREYYISVRCNRTCREDINND